MKDRSSIISWVRSEVVGPSLLDSPGIAVFTDRVFQDAVAARKGPLAWKPTGDDLPQEILYFDRESPHRKYGAGVLHPLPIDSAAADRVNSEAEAALSAADTIGVDSDPHTDEGERRGSEDEARLVEAASDDEFEVSDPDLRRPSTLGVSVCVRMERGSTLFIHIPSTRNFPWQSAGAEPLQLNGRYERCTRRWRDEAGADRDTPAWRRISAVGTGIRLPFAADEFRHGTVLRETVPLPPDSPISLRAELYPRQLEGGDWLVTAVLRNDSRAISTDEERERTLYQSFFEVLLEGGEFRKYPESQRPFDSLDRDEQSLALLYSDSATWAVGHGCAGAWDSDPGAAPIAVYADVMPAVELPSMTPDVEVDGRPVKLAMRTLSQLDDGGSGEAWSSLTMVRDGYAAWISASRQAAEKLRPELAAVAARHLEACEECLQRIDSGITQLRANPIDRQAFRLANLAMLLQQIATKQLQRRSLAWDGRERRLRPDLPLLTPLSIFQRSEEDPSRIGGWRAFQIAFLLMSLRGLSDTLTPERDIVDLIWFPTGGGKTEAYLAVMAFYMFRERLLMAQDAPEAPVRDGTNVLMRYTLRMLTTQQFQRASSLICAMEKLRRTPGMAGISRIPGGRFSLGLWVGGAGSPNKISEARSSLSSYRAGNTKGNPLVLTECPWCRCAIGRYEGNLPHAAQRIAGVIDDADEGPRLVCPDGACDFGREMPDTWLPVEVIDERIYRLPPSLVIATADKLAMTAYRPDARALFGLERRLDGIQRRARPPGLIIQDELHLISGPLGTMYALYEGIFERLCSDNSDGHEVRPKIIASTATIRGAEEQIRTLYGRTEARLFPAPGLTMGDSFFGRYARTPENRLRNGRLYVGLHAADYGSILTTQVRAFAAALFRSALLPEASRDPWWTLLAFYNSIRELGGARTLFDSDIRSRLKFLFNRQGVAADDRRHLKAVEELTSRLSQSEIVEMMDRLAVTFGSQGVMDACLASNIIEVGVDIDRLSLMAVVGQPKTTSTYIQVSGRVGRRWQDRPGLIFTLYNPSKSRDRSHFEQFHGYHRRLYERVEPTSTTPFAISALRRGLAGALLAWARQVMYSQQPDLDRHLPALHDALDLLRTRCSLVEHDDEAQRSAEEMTRIFEELLEKWRSHPQDWEKFPQSPQGEYLMLWPGQFATELQKRRGVMVPSSMRQVDASAELSITPGYALAARTRISEG